MSIEQIANSVLGASDELLGIAPVLTLSVIFHIVEFTFIYLLLKVIREDRMSFHATYTQGCEDIKEIAMMALKKKVSDD